MYNIVKELEEGSQSSQIMYRMVISHFRVLKVSFNSPKVELDSMAWFLLNHSVFRFVYGAHHSLAYEGKDAQQVTRKTVRILIAVKAAGKAVKKMEERSVPELMFMTPDTERRGE